jgi:hypothetical protein
MHRNLLYEGCQNVLPFLKHPLPNIETLGRPENRAERGVFKDDFFKTTRLFVEVIITLL